MAFQMTFAIITVALVAGSVADRMKFSAWVLFSILWLFVVYVPVAHWVWGGGFLGAWGLLDFAGGTVVHINAGVAGLVACLVLGARRGYGSENMSPYDLSLAVIGTGLLWVGWFGFNGGSALASGGRAHDGDRRHALRRVYGRARVDGRGMVDARQAVGARHYLRRDRRPRHHHAGVRLRAALARARHRRRRGPRSASGPARGSSSGWTTTTRSTCSASTASAARSARSSPASSRSAHSPQRRRIPAARPDCSKATSSSCKRS